MGIRAGFWSGRSKSDPAAPRVRQGALAMRRMLSIAVGMLIGATALAAVQPEKKPADTKKQLIVGFSQVGAESAWRTAETKSIRSEAEKRGIDLKFADAQGKQANQINAIRSFI